MKTRQNIHTQPQLRVPHISLLRCGLAALALSAATAQAQFQIQTTHTTASFRGIHALSPQVAWASGTAGTVLRTTDGGTTWQPCTTPPGAEKLDFRGIQAFDDKTAIVMSSGKGDLSRLYKTTDACHSWTLLFTNPDKDGFWDAVKFSDASHGFILGDPITVPGTTGKRFVLKQTFDGGKSWTSWEQKVPTLALGENAAAFAASNSSLILKDKFVAIIGIGGKDGSALIDTMTHSIGICNCNPMPPESLWNDKLNVSTSSEAPFPKTESAGIFAIAENRFFLIAVGGDYKLPDSSEQTAAYKGTGSIKWSSPQTPPHGYRSSVAYDPTTKTWITVGPNGTDISTDDGRNWQPLKPAANEQQDADQNWNALSLPFVVGPKGRIGKLSPDTLKPVPEPKASR